jgi:hypothetical protein
MTKSGSESAMKRWSSAAHETVEAPEVDAFLAEIGDVCRKHGLSISHEDVHGGFIVDRFDERTLEWLMGAAIDPGRASP